MKRTSILPFLALALLFSACDTTEPSVHEEEVIVESYLIAGESLGSVFLTTSIPVDDAYVGGRGGIGNATVSVSLLSADGSVEDVIAYEGVFSASGEYTPTVDHRVVPGRTYRLEANVPGRPLVTAETVVPGAFDLLDVGPLVLPYRSSDQVEFLVTPSAYPGRQAVYIFTIEGLDPRPDNLTPLYFDFLYENTEDDPATLDPSEMLDVLVNSSPPINEGTYQDEGDGTLRVGLPWFAVAFYGQNRITMSALDDATYDFVRYQQVQAGGSTLSPGDIPNVLDRVQNGRGLFGSLTRVQAVADVQRDQ